MRFKAFKRQICGYRNRLGYTADGDERIRADRVSPHASFCTFDPYCYGEEEL